MISKMASPDIFLKIQFIIINVVLKICTQDGKMLVMNVITSLIKNKNKFKIYLFKSNVKKDITSGSPIIFDFLMIRHL